MRRPRHFLGAWEPAADVRADGAAGGPVHGRTEAMTTRIVWWIYLAGGIALGLLLGSGLGSWG